MSDEKIAKLGNIDHIVGDSSGKETDYIKQNIQRQIESKIECDLDPEELMDEDYIEKCAMESVLKFIENFRTYCGPGLSAETIRRVFRGGYCYYFAHMLKIAFHRGTVCVAYPFGHVVWKDINGVSYDIEGEYTGEVEAIIPMSYFGEAYKDFTHVEGELFNASKEFLENCYKAYLENREEEMKRAQKKLNENSCYGM